MTQGKRLNSGTTFLQPEGPVETLHTTVKTDYKDMNKMLQSQQYDIENHHNIYEAQERYINDLEVYARHQQSVSHQLQIENEYMQRVWMKKSRIINPR